MGLVWGLNSRPGGRQHLPAVVTGGTKADHSSEGLSHLDLAIHMLFT